MLTEYHGRPGRGRHIPGGDLEDLHRSRRCGYLKKEPESFPSTSVPYASPREVVLRDGKLRVDNGICHTPRAVLFFSGQEPSLTANCKPNEVDVPERRRPAGAGCARSARRPAADDVDRLQGRASRASGSMSSSNSARRGPPALRLRSRDAHPGEADSRGRASACRAAPRAGSAQVRAARPQHRGRGDVAGRLRWARRSLQLPRPRGRRCAGNDRQDRRSRLIGRLTNCEPAST